MMQIGSTRPTMTRKFIFTIFLFILLFYYELKI